MEQLEGTCRTYDANIMRCIWILLALVIWMVAADAMLPPAATFEYQDEVAEGKAVDVTDDVPKRTFGRVMRTMREHCQSGIVLGPQVLVSGEPFMYRVMRICASGQDFVNPYIAIQGSSSGVCVDEHAGEVKRVTRTYPIAVHSRDASPVTFMALDEVCPVVAALDVLDSKW